MKSARSRPRTTDGGGRPRQQQSAVAETRVRSAATAASLHSGTQPEGDAAPAGPARRKTRTLPSVKQTASSGRGTSASGSAVADAVDTASAAAMPRMGAGGGPHAAAATRTPTT